MAKRLVIFINSAELFLSHRQHLAMGAREEGFEVTVLCPDTASAFELGRQGYDYRTLPLGRKSLAPWKEVRSLWQTARVLRELKPDVLHSFTIKPVLYGTLAGRWLRIPKIVNTVTGLGFAFIDPGFKAAMVRGMLGVVYRFAFHASNLRFIFQNHDDYRFFLDKGWVKSTQAAVIPGTGVDLKTFRPLSLVPNAATTILFAGRYLRDKGLSELVEACRRLHMKGLPFRLLLCGRLDPGNPNSFGKEEFTRLIAQPFIKDLGYQKDMSQVYGRADIVCLPSYREGIPLALMEAAACGRALVATDVPGCREVVMNSENGFLVAAREVDGLESALEKLVREPELRLRFGERSRELAIERFEKGQVVQLGLNVYRTDWKQAG